MANIKFLLIIFFFTQKQNLRVFLSGENNPHHFGRGQEIAQRWAFISTAPVSTKVKNN